MKDKDCKILITGATGLSGRAIAKKLRKQGFTNILTPTHKELDLTTKPYVNEYFKEHKPDYVFHCAGKISTHLSHQKITNSDLLYTDADINLNTINAAASNDVKKLISLGSCWNYPRVDKHLNEGDFDYSSSQGDTSHDISKFFMISLLKNLRNEKALDSTVMMIPPLMGDQVNDNINDRHVFAHLANNIHVGAKQKLKEVKFMSHPSNKRQFLHTDDLGEAAIMALGIDSFLLNVAHDEVFTMEQVVNMLTDKWSYQGKIKWESRTGNVGPQRLDCSLLKGKGWSARIGVKETIYNRLI